MIIKTLLVPLLTVSDKINERNRRWGTVWKRGKKSTIKKVKSEGERVVGERIEVHVYTVLVLAKEVICCIFANFASSIAKLQTRVGVMCDHYYLWILLAVPHVHIFCPYRGFPILFSLSLIISFLRWPRHRALRRYRQAPSSTAVGDEHEDRQNVVFVGVSAGHRPKLAGCTVWEDLHPRSKWWYVYGTRWPKVRKWPVNRRNLSLFFFSSCVCHDGKQKCIFRPLTMCGCNRRNFWTCKTSVRSTFCMLLIFIHGGWCHIHLLRA